MNRPNQMLILLDLLSGVDMPVQLEPDWGRKRRFATDYATDIILNCKSKEDDPKFAKKWGMSVLSVRQIRLGLRWKSLRSQLKNKGEVTLPLYGN